MSAPKKKKGKTPTYRIPADSPWANAWKVAAGLGAVGVALSAFGMFSDPHRFAFSWLFAFMCFLAVGLGGLFFVLGQHLTGAGWALPLRRLAEILSTGLIAIPFLWLPIGFQTGELFEWWDHHGEHHEEGGHGDDHGEGHGDDHGDDAHDEHGALGFGSGTASAQEARDPWDVHPDDREPEPEHAGHHSPEHALHAELLESKTWYLDQVFFYVRAVIYFLAWLGLVFLFFNWSTKQDKVKGLEHSKRMEKWAPASTFVFGFSLTFAAFDWMMALEPTWYSTIFGVIYFANSAIIAHVFLILVGMGLMRSGPLSEALSVEHFHDLGKLLHGFLIFWAYTSFSQFMLIWYAGIPEEATYYHLRWWGGGGFQNLSVIVVVAGFVIPFFLLLSRHFKRRLPMLAFSASWIGVMHVVFCYWLVMPYAEQTGLVETQLRLHWLDFAAFFGVGGVFLAVVLWNLTRYPLVPVGDPRLQRALHHEVV